MKKLFSIVIAVALCLALSITAFAAEVDLSTVGGKQEYAPHGYDGTYGLHLGYGNKTYLGEYNLANYKEVKITYATDNSFTAFKEGMACPAFFALCSADVSVGQVEKVLNEDKIIARADAADAVEVNPSGINWDKNERTTVIDLSSVDYNGKVWFSHFNATGSAVLVIGIEFVEADAEGGNEVETPSDPSEPSEPTNEKVLKVSYDEVRPGIICGGVEANIKTPTLASGTTEATFWGWVAVSENVKSFSYSINGGAKVDQPSAVVEAEQPVLDAAANVEGATTASRFQVVVPVTEGTQTVEIFAEFEDGSESFWTAKVTVGEPTVDDNDQGNAETGDFMFVIVIAAAALVVTVLSKKRAY